MYKYLVFDFDGTLIDSNYLIDLTIRETSKKILGKEIDQEKINKVWGKVLTEQMMDLDPERVDELSEFYSDYYRKHRDEFTTIFDGIKEMLDELINLDCKLAIVTNKGTGGLEHGLEMFQINDYFKMALSKSDVDKKKPHPEGLFRVMNFLGAKPEEVLFIGDSIHDIECGQNAGVDTVLVSWTVIDLEALLKLKPTYVIDTPNDLVQIVKSKKDS